MYDVENTKHIYTRKTQKFLAKVRENWHRKLIAGEKTLAEVNIQRSIFLRDSLKNVP